MAALNLQPIPHQCLQDAFYYQYQDDFKAHQSFIDKWGILKGKFVINGTLSKCGTVINTRYNFLVAKCFKKAMNERAWREAKTLYFLRSEQIPYTPQLYGVSPYTEEAILIVDYAGPDLYYSYKMGHLQLEDITRIAKETLKCVQLLAEKGMTHNDIKPPNICYTRGRGTTLIDWEGATSSKIPYQGRSYTKAYQPPELCIMLNYATDAERSKADVWAVAATIFFLVAFNGPLINGKENSRADVLDATVQRFFPLPQEMIDASPLKEKLFLNNRLRFLGVCKYVPAAQALEQGKKIAQTKYHPYSASQYDKVGKLVLDLLRINPKERPSAEEALKKHFPPAEPLNV